MTITPFEQDDKRWYPIPNPPDGPDPGVVRQYPSVTTIIDPISSPGLVPWAGWLAAKHAIANLPTLVAAMLRKPCGRTYHGHGHEFGERCVEGCACGRCLPCWQKKLGDMHKTEAHRRAEEGKEVHRYIEDWIMHSGVVRWTPSAAAQPYITQFLAFVKAYGLTPESFLFTEAIAFHPDEDYAGTTDGAVRLVATASPLAAYVVAACLRVTVKEAIARELHADVLIDWKSTEKQDTEEKKHQVKFYPSNALQLCAYRRAPKIMIRNSTLWVEMPETHGAVCVQLRLDGFTARVVDTGDKTFAAFKAQRVMFQWLHEEGSRCVSSNRNPDTKPIPEDAARKAAKAAAAAAAAEALAAANPEGMASYDNQAGFERQADGSMQRTLTPVEAQREKIIAQLRGQTAAERKAFVNETVLAMTPAEINWLMMTVEQIPIKRAARKAAAAKAAKPAAGKGKPNLTMAAMRDPFELVKTGARNGISDDEIPF